MRTSTSNKNNAPCRRITYSCSKLCNASKDNPIFARASASLIEINKFLQYLVMCISSARFA